MKTAEEILKEHIIKSIGDNPEQYYSVDEIMAYDETKVVLAAMHQFATECIKADRIDAAKNATTDYRIEEKGKICSKIIFVDPQSITDRPLPEILNER